jgi:hypothetical protein
VRVLRHRHVASPSGGSGVVLPVTVPRVTRGPGDVPAVLPGASGPGSEPGERHGARRVVLRGIRGRLADRTVLRYGVSPFLAGADVLAWVAAVALTGHGTGGEVVVLALTLGLYASAGLYASRLSLSALDDMPALVGRALAAAALATSVALLLDPALVDAGLLRTAAVFAVVVVALRALAYSVVRAVRARGWIGHATLVLGAGRVGGQLVRTLLEHREYGLRPVGFLDADPFLSEDERPVPLLGGHESLASVIVEFGVRDVVVAFGSVAESSMVDIIRTCDRLDAEIFFVPRLFELHTTSRDMDQVWGMPLVRLRRAAFRSPSWRLPAGRHCSCWPPSWRSWRSRSGSRAAPASCSARSAWGSTAGPSRS